MAYNFPDHKWGRPGNRITTPAPPPSLQRAIWSQVGWYPHPLQERVLLETTRNKVLSAGRRTGKSQVGGYRLIPEAFRAQGEADKLRSARQRREYWIVGPEYSDAEKEFRVAWDVFKALGFPFDKPGSYNNPNTGDMHLSLFGGLFQLHAKSAKYPETLVGEGLSGVVMSEAAKLKSSVWYKFIRPTLADFGGWSLFSSTPEGKNWFYELWQAGQDPQRHDWSSYKAPSWVNPYVYPVGANPDLVNDALEARRKDPKQGVRDFLDAVETVGHVPSGIDPEIWSLLLDMSSETFVQEIAAEFTEFVGRVFKDFDEEIHVTDQEFRHDWMTFACVDYGFTNPFVWLLIQVDPHGERVHVLNEYYERHRTTPEAAADILARGLAPSSCLGFYPDPAEPDRTKEMSRLLQIRSLSPGSVGIAGRIEWIRRLLKVQHPHLPWGHPERVPRLTFHRRNCPNAIAEHAGYRYPKTAEQASLRDQAAPENPIKKDDHTVEALGRFVSGRFGQPWKDSRARQGRVAVGRRSK